MRTLHFDGSIRPEYSDLNRLVSQKALHFLCHPERALLRYRCRMLQKSSCKGAFADTPA